ncbi:MAG: hypothetical protein JXR45_00485 [Deltaproteobacteria bacterium]|nr:hypothetical protein [Deltaproteobacteria bacterium]
MHCEKRFCWVIGLFLMVSALSCAPQFDRYGLDGVSFVLKKPIPPPKKRSTREPIDCSGRLFVKVPNDGEDTFQTANHEMEFEGKTYPLRLQVSTYLYRATLATLEQCTFSTSDGLVSYYRKIIEQPAMRSFYESMLTPLREIRNKEGFDDSAYARLIIRFVQSFAYCEQFTGNPKPPVATVVEGCGDCDEKSALLAGLLAAEGFDVCLLLFQNHMAVGLGTDEDGFQRTDYLYVESTAVTRPGLSDGLVSMDLAVDPVSIGEGTKKFFRSDAGKRIDDLYEQALVGLNEYRADISEASAVRFSGIEVLLEDVEAAKKSVQHNTAELSYDEKMYLVYASALIYCTYSPDSEQDMVEWLENYLAWTAKFENSEAEK